MTLRQDANFREMQGSSPIFFLMHIEETALVKRTLRYLGHKENRNTCFSVHMHLCLDLKVVQRCWVILYLALKINAFCFLLFYLVGLNNDVEHTL